MHNMEIDLAVNSNGKMGKSREKNVTYLFCINVHTAQRVHPSRVLLNYSTPCPFCLWSLERWMLEQSGFNCTTGMDPVYNSALPKDGNAYNFRKVMLPPFMFFESLEDGQNSKVKYF